MNGSDVTARWFMLLQPVEASPSWNDLLAELEPLTGGQGDTVPHVTVAHGQGRTTIADVAAAARTLRGAGVSVRANGAPVFWAGPAMHFHWTIAQPVARSEGLRPWYEATWSTLHGLGLVAEDERWQPWQQWRPYVTVVRGGEGRPAPDEATREAALRVLLAKQHAVDFVTEQLWVSRLEHGRFQPVTSVLITQ
jgi:hypothetical protein